MSEPSQLIARFHLSAAQHQRFLEHIITPAKQYADFVDWLAAGQFYGKDTPGIEEKILNNAPHGTSVQHWLTELVDTCRYGPLINQYDEATGEWTLTVVDFSESYGNFVDALNVLRQISAFKDLPEPDYIVIMDNWFSATGFANTTAIIEATPGASRFVEQAPEDFQRWTAEKYAIMAEMEIEED